MSRKKYRPWSPDQTYLLPPSAKDLLPADHFVFFVRDLLNELDMTPIVRAIQAKDPRGNRPYDPRLMLWILVYGYACGIHSSRKLEKATWEDLAFRVICGDSHPHFTTINEFRRTHRRAFSALFVGVLKLCQEAGMVKLGHVAIDGSKVKADASKHKASSHERLTKSERKLLAEVDELLDRSEREDADEDARFGVGRREFELPDELKGKQNRLATLKAASARLKQGAKESRAATLRENAAGLRERAEDAAPAEAKRKRTLADKAEAAAEDLDPRRDDDEPPAPPTALPTHRVLAKADGTPKPKQQVNFVDADSRLMKGRDGGFIQAYNAQIAVDEGHHVIVAEGVSNLAPDQKYLGPMVHRVIENTGQVPDIVTADAGYWSEAQVAAVEQTGTSLLVARRAGRATEREPPGGIGPPSEPLVGAEWMRWKMRQAPNRAVFKKRKSTVEPVFGNIKEARGFRQFSFRGLQAVAAEWSLICTVHNVLKLFRARKMALATA